MRKTLLSFTVLGVLTSISSSYAETPFKPEHVSVEKEIKPGPNVFVIDQSWSGSSMITVVGADDLKAKGNISTGLISQFTLSSDHKQLYTASVYPKRIVWGDVDAVVQQFDVNNLTFKKEIESSPKMAQSAAYVNSFQLSANDKYAFVQNATPAASVSVIDIASGKSLLEIPTPGCWGIYPSQTDDKFSALCGDGTLASYQVSGSTYQASKSEPIFNTDDDALFITAQRDGDSLMLTSFNGNMYVLDDSGKAVKLKEKFSYTKDIEGGWLPGGYQVIGYNKPNHVMFVAMHPDGKEGSHKDGAKEVWGVDMKTHKVVTRIETKEPISIAVSQTKAPELFTLTDEGEVVKYVFSEGKLVGKEESEVEGLGAFSQMLMVDY
ncbi:amine dehydrogenase large subunit [Vibrio rumoiensis]|uniref:amine dehydrogenase large subunit n=1 Tax=Vibrio rumoiensis TaxID=76258 RepID=UPI003AA7C10B